MKLQIQPSAGLKAERLEGLRRILSFIKLPSFLASRLSSRQVRRIRPATGSDARRDKDNLWMETNLFFKEDVS